MKTWITPKEAAKKAKVTEITITNWCKEYGIGKKVGGRWRINPKEFQKVLNGSMYKELKRPKKEKDEI